MVDRGIDLADKRLAVGVQSYCLALICVARCVCLLSLMLEHDPNMRFRIDRPRSYPFSRQTRSNTLPSRSSLLADASCRTAVDVLGSQMDYDSSRKEAEEREEVYCHVSQTVHRES